MPNITEKMRIAKLGKKRLHRSKDIKLRIVFCNIKILIIRNKISKIRRYISLRLSFRGPLMFSDFFMAHAWSLLVVCLGLQYSRQLAGQLSGW